MKSILCFFLVCFVFVSYIYPDEVLKRTDKNIVVEEKSQSKEFKQYRLPIVKSIGTAESVKPNDKKLVFKDSEGKIFEFNIGPDVKILKGEDVVQLSDIMVGDSLTIYSIKEKDRVDIKRIRINLGTDDRGERIHTPPPFVKPVSKPIAQPVQDVPPLNINKDKK